MQDTINLHPEFGLNPTICVCAYCKQPTQKIALLGNSYKGEAPKEAILSLEPCDKCKEKYKDDVIIVHINNEKQPDSYKIIAKEKFKEIFTGDEELLSVILEKRVALTGD